MNIVNVAVVYEDPSDKSQSEFKLIEILVGVGTNVIEHEVLAVAETEKAAIEIESPVAGKIHEILLKLNNPDDDKDVYHHGDILCTIETN